MTEEEVRTAEKELNKAATDFKEAISRFAKVFNHNTVNLEGWAEDIDDVMFDISEDINNSFVCTQNGTRYKMYVERNKL